MSTLSELKHDDSKISKNNNAKTVSFGGITKIKKGKSLHKRNTYIIYLMITFAFGAIQSSPSTLIPQFERQINLSNISDISWLFAARSLGYFCSTIIVGIQLDWFDNTHYFASLTMIISLIPFIFMNIVTNFDIFIAFWFIIGFVTGTMEISVPVYIWRLYATSASTRYTLIGVMSGIGGTIMPLVIQLSLYIFKSYNIALYILAFMLFITAFFLIVYKTPKHESVVTQIKTVRIKNMQKILTLRNKQKQLESNNNNDLSIGIELKDINTEIETQSQIKQPETRKMKTFELFKRTFTQILISNEINDDEINIFDIEENENAAGMRMNGIFNPILLHEINEANENAGIDNILSISKISNHHFKLKPMLSTHINNINQTDILNYNFSWLTPRLDPNINIDNINYNLQIPVTPINQTGPKMFLYDTMDDYGDINNDSIGGEEMNHWFGIEKPIGNLLTKMRGNSRRYVLDTQKQMKQYQNESMQFYGQMHTQHGDKKDINKVSKDSNTNWNAMKDGLKRVRYKQEIIILCVNLMLFFYGWQTVLLANIISFVKHENIGRYLISIYSFSKYISRFVLLMFSKQAKGVSLQQMTFRHLLLLLIASFIFWIISYVKLDNKNHIYLYLAFTAFGMFGACVKTAVFSICNKIQPVSGFIASIFLLSKCLGDGIIPWIVAMLINKYSFNAYIWFIGFMPFIIIISWVLIITLFKRYNDSKNKVHNIIQTDCHPA
eukprot:440220_1